MVETERVRQPLDFFPTIAEASSILGALRAGAFDEKQGPDYILVDSILRKLGKSSTHQLTPFQRERLHAFFLEERPLYNSAHSKLQGKMRDRLIMYK